jgi:predicted DsbA family dithiol-disulfide isomerase
MMARMRIRFVSDVVCPFCHIGERNLALALERRPDLDVHVEVLPFQLSPGMPEGGRSKQEIIDRLAQNDPSFLERIDEVAKETGISFRFDRIDRVPNTLAAHALMRWAKEQDLALTLARRLFVAYFEEGLDIGDHEVLARLATEAGMDEALVRARLAARDEFDDVASEAEMLRSSGITAVPFVLFGDVRAIVGAQPVEAFVAALDEAAPRPKRVLRSIP